VPLAGTKAGLADFSFERGVTMPVWMEILLNVIGYAGFVAIATFHKPSGKLPCDEGKCVN
jgi:hypothetical protein